MRYTLLILLFAINTTYAQQQKIDWVNAHAHPLSTEYETPGIKDLSFLADELAGKQVVALGEASHGTREFYLQKARIIAYLVIRQQFRVLTFEFQDSLLQPVNRFVRTGEGNLKAAMKSFALYNTEEIYRLLMWIRQYNTSRTPADQVTIHGVDHADYWPDPFTRDRHMAANLVRHYEAQPRKTMLWAHNVHIIKDTTAKYQSMGAYLMRHFGDRFYALCMDTYSGSVNVINGGGFEVHPFSGMPDGFSSLLAKAKHEAFYLSFRGNQPFANDTVSLTTIHSNWQGTKPLPVKPGTDMDALVFIRNSTASVKVE
ncbi:erythromycin esterase family protein [Chitinophaga horti]|uniref:Erythromycin esterase family protein n=1 Tax=Chitinophaga horti TaxID=2920382 RepID=A0ABY6J9T9_9BACT|nr:erythromycin esterase family protein [Chitinophaga horti]UYQ95066.1 erythromycin esterase family protein [Chitinophaga horti]